MNKTPKSKVLALCEFGMLVAVEIVMSVTPLGYLNLPFLAASLLTIPVAIGAIMLGTWASTLLGLVFGITSFIKGFSSTSPMTVAMYAMSVPKAFVVAVIGRVLMGLCAGLVVRAVRKARPKGLWDNIAGSLAAPLFNTAFFMGLLMLFYYRSDYIQDLIATTGVSSPLLLICVMVGTQALIEAAACGVISTAVSKALQAAVHRE
ncbi:MAG: ECF transporter S component [Clostridia bacterium]|nr:ECF transporter S component [Clostridia bacterium]